jgi:hypothetical protein
MLTRSITAKRSTKKQLAAVVRPVAVRASLVALSWKGPLVSVPLSREERSEREAPRITYRASSRTVTASCEAPKSGRTTFFPQRCHSKAARLFDHDVRRPRLRTAFEAERAAEMKVLEREHKRRLKPSVRKPRRAASCKRSSFEIGAPNWSSSIPSASSRGEQLSRAQSQPVGVRILWRSSMSPLGGSRIRRRPFAGGWR